MAQTQPTTAPVWIDPQPDVAHLPKPTTQPIEWLVEHDPVTPDASPEARALLKFLYSISCQHTLTGQHNYAAEQEISTYAAFALAGKTPAIYGTDLGFAKAGDHDSAYVRQETVQELIRQYKNGTLITITWHAVPPTKDEPVTFHDDVQSHLTRAQFVELTTPGTPLFERWAAQVDVIAVYLKQLQDAHVPVLFRPYHEMNGDWFWWGGWRGVHGTKTLYRQIWDRLVNRHRLTNLIWVWNVDRPSRQDRQFVDYFPGNDCVDVLSLDCYGHFEPSYYDELNALSDGKPLAIAETGLPPAIAVYRRQPKWTWYLIWAGMAKNSPDFTLAEMVKDPRMFSLEDPEYQQLSPVNPR